MNLTHLPRRDHDKPSRTLDKCLEDWLLCQERLLSRWLRHTWQNPSARWQSNHGFSSKR